MADEPKSQKMSAKGEAIHSIGRPARAPDERLPLQGWDRTTRTDAEEARVQATLSDDMLADLQWLGREAVDGDKTSDEESGGSEQPRRREPAASEPQTSVAAGGAGHSEAHTGHRSSAAAR
jgi:hypothetical protein